MSDDFEEDDVKEMLSDAEVEDETIVEKKGPTPLDPEWTAYALTLFDKDELDEQGNPSTDGMRRVTEVAIGPILVAKAHVVESASPKNGLRATVEFTIVVQDRWLGTTREVTDAADVYPGNVKEQMYAQFPVAMATTRAEGRALRKLLRLRKIVASEEVTTVSPEEALAEAPISDVQLKQIDTMCKRSNINALKLLSLAKDEDGNTFEDYKEIPRSIGRKICAKLNEWQQKPKGIPENVVGYVTEWRKDD
jgi:hypothetical protein